MPKNVGYLNRGLFLIIVALIWILYEHGTVENVLQFGGWVLVLFGAALVVVALVVMGDREVAA